MGVIGISIASSFRPDNRVKNAFTKVREEFEEHLLAINENTSEIAQNHEYLCEVESRMERLQTRLDHMQLFLRQMGYALDQPQMFSVRPLSTEEKKIFLVLYTIEERKGHVTYHDIACELDMETNLVAGYIASLLEKGVPVVKRYVNDIAYLRLDQDFKQVQAKENVLQIDKAQKQLVCY